MSVAENVKKILEPIAKKYHPAAVVVAPLQVWDVNDGSMGVNIKAPKKMGNQNCEMTVSLVLSPKEYRDDTAIAVKGNIAVQVLKHSIMSQVKLRKTVKEPKAGEA